MDIYIYIYMVLKCIHLVYFDLMVDGPDRINFVVMNLHIGMKFNNGLVSYCTVQSKSYFFTENCLY